MSFFNKKEDVIDIELTQFGKYLLSKGKFKPVFYTFSDDEILYNNAYVNSDTDKFNETGKETSKRIQRDTQRLKVLYDQEGIETRVAKRKAYRIDRFNDIINTPSEMLYGEDHMYDEKMGADDRKLVRNFLGNSTIGEQGVPSWELDSLLHGQIKSVNISSSSPHIGMKRPVLEYEVDHTLNIERLGSNHPDYNITSDQFENRYTGLEREFSFVDDIKLTVDEGIMIFSVIEDNVDYDLENFEIEFYEVERGPNFRNPNGTVTEEELIPMYTTNNEFLDNANSDSIAEAGYEYIEHYFDMMTDQDLAEFYGFDLRGINRDKLRDMFSNAISDYYKRLDELRRAGLLASFADGDPINTIPRTLGSMGEIGQSRTGVLDDAGEDTGIPVQTDSGATGGPSSANNENRPVSLGDEEDICDD